MSINLEHKIREILSDPEISNQVVALNKIRFFLSPNLPWDSLLGVRAEHPVSGHGIIASHKVDEYGKVRFSSRSENYGDGVKQEWVPFYRLTILPSEAPENSKDALKETLNQVRDALTEIDRLEDDTWAAWERDADMYEQGRSNAYHRAHIIITEALGDTL